MAILTDVYGHVVPPSFVASCYFCVRAMDTRDLTAYQYTQGWARNKNKGNSLTLAQREHKWACGECIDKLKHGVPVGQMGLWDNG